MWMPQYTSSGTSRTPMRSRSSRRMSVPRCRYGRLARRPPRSIRHYGLEMQETQRINRYESGCAAHGIEPQQDPGAGTPNEAFTGVVRCAVTRPAGDVHDGTLAQVDGEVPWRSGRGPATRTGRAPGAAARLWRPGSGAMASRVPSRGPISAPSGRGRRATRRRHGMGARTSGRRRRIRTGERRPGDRPPPPRAVTARMSSSVCSTARLPPLVETRQTAPCARFHRSGRKSGALGDPDLGRATS
ncbi:hypothetical protein FB387_005133 [Streptomyces cinereoruber]|nr:hypothetical protein [Streptomyces cinereoruber]NIH63922.1 hypothetical protein [Streptomyces cinereoruber]